MKKTVFLLSILVLIGLTCICCQHKNENTCRCTPDPLSLDTVSSQQLELDSFYTLMAYAVVYKDWQQSATKQLSRGYNIGSVLVDSNNQVVNWGRNSVNVSMNESKHGEVMLIQSYLDSTKTFSLKGFTIYTTLEPCAMCSGMMKLTEVHRTVYGQTDPSYGKALERLQLNSSSCGGGYTPYPRTVISDKSPDPVSIAIDSAYAQHSSDHITTFLATPDAEILFKQASDRFSNYLKAKFVKNQEIIDNAHTYFKTVSGKKSNISIKFAK